MQELEKVNEVLIQKEVSNSTAKDQVGSVLLKDRATILREFDGEEQAQPLAARSTSPEALPKELKNFDVLMKHGKSALAFPLILSVLKRDSWNVPALDRLALVMKVRGEVASETKIREALVRVNPSFEAYEKLAYLYYQQNQDHKALDMYNEALAVVDSDRPELFDIFKNIGNILVRQNDFEGAEESYNKAYTLNPDSDTLLVSLATLSIQKNDFNQALERYRRAITVSSNNDKAWVGLALVHQHMGDLDLALGNVMNAIELNPKNRTATHLLCNWLSFQENWMQVIDVLQNYLSRVEYDEELSLVLIHAMCVTNQFTFALVEIERVLLYNPNQKEVYELKQKIEKEFLK